MNFEILIVSLVSYISFYDTYLFPLSFFFYRFDAFVSKGIVTTRATDLPVFSFPVQSATNYSWYLFERLTYFNFS